MDSPDSIRFQPFSAMHVAVVLVFVALVAAGVWLGRRLQQRGRRQDLDYTLAALAAVAWIVNNGWWMLPQNYDRAISLPLHVCDFTALIVPIVLVWPRRWLRSLLYFWGLGLSTQGFITPGITDGPAQIGFWFFWANHFFVVGIAIYDVAARGFRPGWRDCLIAIVLAIAYVALILPVDLIFDVNYGYVGPEITNTPSLLDYFGPWPLRVLVMVAVGSALMALLTAPWVVAQRRTNRS